MPSIETPMGELSEMRITGIRVTPGTMEQLHARITVLIERGWPSWVLSGNVHGLNLARKYPWLARMYDSAGAVRVDGAGIVMGAKILGATIPQRNTWADWGWPLASYLAQKNHSVFLLGGPKGAAQETARLFKQKNPSLDLRGFAHGFFLKDPAETCTVVDAINHARPDVLIVGMGMPLQEKWIWENHKNLNVKVYLTAGAAFEYLSGQMKRCPVWMGNAGLEWVYRLCQSPGRMANRYLLGNLLFLVNVFLQRISKQGNAKL